MTRANLGWFALINGRSSWAPSYVSLDFYYRHGQLPVSHWLGIPAAPPASPPTVYITAPLAKAIPRPGTSETQPQRPSPICCPDKPITSRLLTTTPPGSKAFTQMRYRSPPQSRLPTDRV